MSYQKERETFLAQWVREGGSIETARLILRDANTAQRLAAAQCNGDYPFDNGERTVDACAECGMGCAPRAMRKGRRCPSCVVDARLAKRIRESGFTEKLSGDPRGYVVKVRFPSGTYNTWGGREEGYGVPAREY
jgi:hypothetical protein